MTRKPFGPLCQNAFVVPDIDVAITYWTQTCGVGPFFKFPPLEFTGGEVHGRPVKPAFKAAIAYSGDLMIELIEPAGESIFAEFLAAGGQGVHHNCVLADDLDAAEAWLVARGGRRVQALDMADGSRIAYFDVPGATPIVLEVAQLSAQAQGMFAMIRDAAASWNGIDPLLSLG